MSSMQLFLNATSPYARFVRVLGLELGLEEQIELIWVDPWQNDPALLAVNPAAKIPTLRCASGQCLSESLLIAQYLQQHPQATASAAAGSEQDLAWLGLGQALMDAAFQSVIHKKYHPEAVKSLLDQRRQAALQRLLAELEQQVDQGKLAASAPTSSLSAGQLSLFVGLDYLAFRCPELDWPTQAPQLAAWHQSLAQRTSLSSTAFH
ncbi:glutathione S-transferase family protein [Marinospirillum sp. MEB164]|uniref:Glutathione S-transferase family protein n=1 Tax=Marinospirillum alkalitolerans TaxID=3123374 RepID=A0ABW8PWG0_9GAMM